MTDEGVDLAGYTLAQRVDDLEAVRKALDHGRIDLLSESIGTRTAMIYAWRYPESIHRSVMIGVNPPGHFLWDPNVTNELIAHYADHCSEYATCSKRTGVASFYGLAETTSELDAPIYAAGRDRRAPSFAAERDQVVLDGFGHSTSFWTEQPEAGTRLISTFLSTGEVDDSLYEPQPVDFTPEVAQPALGKGIAGAMAGLALLTVLSLLWMTVRRRARFPRKTSAVLRSVYAVVLGLGGWFLGVLLVITTLPGTPLDDERLATFSVGLPLGLGIYFAWRNRDWSARIKTAGFLAAVLGGLVGAWLGFYAAVDLLALITAIVGAVAGANLTLILLDISMARSIRQRLAAADARVTMHASPSTG